jgi:hypothetical protein
LLDRGRQEGALLDGSGVDCVAAWQCRRRRGKCGVLIGAALLRGDGSGRRRCRRGTRPRSARIRRDAAVGPVVRCARPACTARTRRRAAREDSKEPRGVGAWGRCVLERRAALGGVRPWPNFFAGHQFENNFLQNFVYKCTKR